MAKPKLSEALLLLEKPKKGSDEEDGYEDDDHEESDEDAILDDIADMCGVSDEDREAFKASMIQFKNC